MPKVKLGKLRELHAHLTSILNDCDAERAPGEDVKVGAGQITNTLTKPAMDSAHRGNGRGLRVDDIEGRKAYAAGSLPDDEPELKIDYARLHR
jgi:hypothetical protein